MLTILLALSTVQAKLWWHLDGVEVEVEESFRLSGELAGLEPVSPHRESMVEVEGRLEMAKGDSELLQGGQH